MITCKQIEHSKMEVENEKKNIPVCTPAIDPFFGQIKNVQSQIGFFENVVNGVKRIQVSLFNPSTSFTRNIYAQQNKLLTLNQQIRKSSSAIKAALNQLEVSIDGSRVPLAQVDNNGPIKLSPTQIQIRKSQLSFVQKWFTDLVVEHSTFQVIYNEKLKREFSMTIKSMGTPRNGSAFGKRWIKAHRRPLDEQEEMVDNIDSGELLIWTIRFTNSLPVTNAKQVK